MVVVGCHDDGNEYKVVCYFVVVVDVRDVRKCGRMFFTLSFLLLLLLRWREEAVIGDRLKTGCKRDDDDDDVTFCTRDPGQEKVRSEEINNIKLFLRLLVSLGWRIRRRVLMCVCVYDNNVSQTIFDNVWVKERLFR